jgi:predicted ATPase
MPLKSFTINGYKAYSSDTTVSVRPLTLMYGENSSGKSSLMRILPLLKETVDDPDSAYPFKLVSAITKTATMGDLFSKLRADNTISIVLDFDEAENNLTLQYIIREFKRDIAGIFTFVATSNQGKIEIELDLQELEASNLPFRGTQRYVWGKSNEKILGLSFQGLIPFLDQEGTSAEPLLLSQTLELCRKALLTLNRCHWLGPLRSSIPRIERINSAFTNVGEKGDGASQVLYADSASNGPIFTDVAAWFKQYCNVDFEVVLGAQEFGALASLALVRTSDKPVRIPLEDAGEGMSQVLPVLVLAAMAAHGRLGENPIVILEHPDLHLHSSAHFGVVDYLIKCLKSPFHPRFIVESHSESVLIASQLAIIDERLPPDEFLAYYISGGIDGSSSAMAVELDKHGNATEDRYLALDWFSVANRKALELARKLIAG